MQKKEDVIIKLTSAEVDDFQRTIQSYYHTYGRQFAWRQTTNPYHIVVSEIMLQQTQTHRVVDKYDLFITQLPTWSALASAPLSQVLSLWQGLGYNRRAKALHEIARRVVEHHHGILVNDPDVLQTFPGIGYATACSITAFAFGRPTIFIETNVRAVFIHCFFKNQDCVHDKQLMPLVAQTLYTADPRTWYYALMDYGVMLKKKYPNPSRRSTHHAKQSKFQGSDRQIRGAIIRFLTRYHAIHYAALIDYLAHDRLIQAEQKRSMRILDDLIQEEMVGKQGDLIMLPEK